MRAFLRKSGILVWVIAAIVLATVLGLVVGIFAFPFALIISNRELAKEKNEIKRLTAIANAA